MNSPLFAHGSAFLATNDGYSALWKSEPDLMTEIASIYESLGDAGDEAVLGD